MQDVWGPQSLVPPTFAGNAGYGGFEATYTKSSNSLHVIVRGKTQLISGLTNIGGVVQSNQDDLDSLANILNIIGDANYDIGHVYSTGGGGIAFLGSICSPGSKARGVTGQPTPIGDPFDVDYVAHEMGHQFGANHTQNNNCNRSSAAAYEPGSASTIMGYAGICPPNVQSNSDDYFHIHSLLEMKSELSFNNCYTVETVTNTAPVIIFPGNGLSIPKGTPFRLDALATDAEGDSLTYCFEQYNLGPPSSDLNNPSGIGPAYRSIDPDTDPFRSLPRLSKVLTGSSFPTAEPLVNYGRPFTFRLSVRDHHPGGSAVSWSQIAFTMSSTSGPFELTAPVQNEVLLTNQWYELKWNVANTNLAPFNTDSLVVLLSTNDGASFDTLAQKVYNGGSWWFQMPAGSETPVARILLQARGNIFYNVTKGFQIQTGTVGLDEVADARFVLYPNPSAGVLVMKADDLQTEATYRVVDVRGSVLATGTFTGEARVELAHLPSGTYVVQLSTAEGVETHRWVRF